MIVALTFAFWAFIVATVVASRLYYRQAKTQAALEAERLRAERAESELALLKQDIRRAQYGAPRTHS